MAKISFLISFLSMALSIFSLINLRRTIKSYEEIISGKNEYIRELQFKIADLEVEIAVLHKENPL